ncbi:MULTISPECIES: accessory Sec system protein translocase subunit SecY2 [Aerococcus]|uniref:Accessory Sec system protein translocase subunit SecY2 n=2 Tax=Aerococcus TaxID=1375 RepID=A0A1E9PE96_9LACT|nr:MULTISPECIES: accessory Sec system protein translocase subunit SecY2 [Aerococcus]KAA9242218.1 accessory Sec system protein translocase subunit SecY2 [Aerococcus urinae]KAA9291554.1 accessory Sec system protein translocase subunit SecY2 [Aerococcus mictus]MCY3034857.1 accessory Sec system protein translocase subunit SecY2 [Aerococcus mictus]MCY3064193.1 accessory Sec system protein translocase subunit SecY2 [Aerococcus mictus]MCY3064786.1 accessory Sec system protein translocase subunit SecY
MANQNKANRFRLPLLYKKLLFTAMILIIYIIGRSIPLPLVDWQTIQQSSSGNDFLSLALSATGGSFEQATLLSLGLGPYMSTMIIWRFISMSKWYKALKVPPRQDNYYRNLLTLILALVQAITLAVSYPLISIQETILSNNFMVYGTIVLALVAGTFFTIWLGGRNQEAGIGGHTIIILANMLLRLPNNFKALRIFLVYRASLIEQVLLISVSVFALMTAFATIVMDRAELRIPINSVMINNNFTEKSYLPIKLNPSGGMAIMYAMTLALLPQYIIDLILIFFPNLQFLKTLQYQLNMTQPLGAFLYVLLIIVLSLGFAFVNVDPEDLSEKLQKTGDYIDGINPGKPTEKFLREKILNMAIIGAVYMTAVVGFPMSLGVLFPEYSQWLNLPGSIVILVALFLNTIDEIRALRIRNKYKPLFD